MDGEEVVGIISRRDLLRPLFWSMQDSENAVPSDSDIARQLDRDLAAHSWSNPRAFTTIVRDGVVELEGVVFSKEQRDTVRTLAENVRGVQAVNDRLITMHPIAGTATARLHARGRTDKR